MRALARGYTLIEQMVVVAMLGLLAVGAYSVRGMLSDGGSPGHVALRTRQATELLVKARQEALLEPLVEGVRRWTTVAPAMEMTRTVESAAPGLLRVTLEAKWAAGARRRGLKMVTARARP